MDVRIDGVNIFNPLEGQLDDIIECMVEFYGEKHRTRIEERIRSSEFFFVPNNGLSPLSSDIKKYFDNKRLSWRYELYAKLTDEHSRVRYLKHVSIENILKLKAHKVNAFTYAVITDILLFLKVLKTKDDKLLEQGKTKMQVSDERMSRQETIKFMENEENWKLIDDFVAKVEQLYNDNKPMLDQINQDESTALQQVAPYDEQVLNSKTKFTNTMSSFICEKLTDVLGSKLATFPTSKLSNLSQTYLALLDIVQNLNWMTSNFLTASQKNEFIKFFKAIGYDEGDDFKLYLPLIQELSIFSEKTCVEYKILKDTAINELAKNNPLLQESVAKIDQLDLLAGSLDFASTLYNFMNNRISAGAYIQVFITSNHELKPILVCPLAINSPEQFTVHELGHIVECDLLSVDEKQFTISSGFDSTTEYTKKKDYTGKNILMPKDSPKQIRKYEVLNEIINDYFSVELFKIMQKRGLKLALGRAGKSEYSLGFSLLKDFIEENKDILIDCRMSGDPYAFAKIIGEENFELLAQTCNEYLEQPLSTLLIIKDTVKVLEKETGCSFTELLYTHDWPTNLKGLVELYKNIDQIKTNVKIKKVSGDE